MKAINGISFTIGRGEALALVGESGSGKTTTGRCLMRLLEPTSGTILYKDQDITRALRQEGLTIARRTVAKYREELGILPSHQRRLAVRKRA